MRLVSRKEVTIRHVCQCQGCTEIQLPGMVCEATTSVENGQFVHAIWCKACCESTSMPVALTTLWDSE